MVEWPPQQPPRGEILIFRRSKMKESERNETNGVRIVSGVENNMVGK